MRTLTLIAFLSLLVGLTALRTYGQCCARKMPVLGAPIPDTPTPAQSPTPTATVSDVCAFHTTCDGSALSGVSDASNGQTYTWVNPTAARIIDSASAGGTTLVANTTSQYLLLTNYAGSNLSGGTGGCGDVPGVNNVPDDATVLGIRVQVRGCEVGSANPPEIRDVEMRLVVGGVILGGSNLAKVGGWDATYNCVHGSGDRFYGSNSELWGYGALTGADIKASNFGLALSVTAFGGDVAPTVDGFALDSICYKLVGE